MSSRAWQVLLLSIGTGKVVVIHRVSGSSAIPFSNNVRTNGVAPRCSACASLKPASGAACAITEKARTTTAVKMQQLLFRGRKLILPAGGAGKKLLLLRLARLSLMTTVS